jgi:hypothetical protein
MSQISGTLPAHEPFHNQTEGWKELVTMVHVEVKSVFELREDGYEMARSFLEASSKGRNKLYLVIAKQGIYAIKYWGRDQAAQMSKVADVAPDLEETDRLALERQAKLNATGFDAFADCSLFALQLFFGAYTGGVFLAVVGVGAASKCLVSATKYYEATQGYEESWFDSGFGKAVDVTSTTINLFGVAGKGVTTGIKGIHAWKMAGKSGILPSIGKYYGKTAALKITKLFFVDFPAVALGAYDLVTKYNQGIPMYGGDLQRMLDLDDSQPATTCIPYEPMFRNPTKWLQETLNDGFVHVPWSEECRR